MDPFRDSNHQHKFEPTTTTTCSSISPTFEDRMNRKCASHSEASPQSDTSRTCSDATTTAPTQTVGMRKRVYRACEVCRRKKVKCNGKNPCSHCIAFVEKCHYADTKDRTAYSRRYVESLEQRLAKMEQAFLMSSEGLVFQQTADGGIPHPEEAGLTLAGTIFQQAHEEGKVSYGQVGQLGGNAFVGIQGTNMQRCTGRLEPDANHHLRYIGPSSAMATIAERSQTLSCNGTTGYEGLGSIGVRSASGPQTGLLWLGSSPTPLTAAGESYTGLDDHGNTLPHRATCDRLVNTFFDRIHPIFPVLCRQSFTASYESLFRPSIPPPSGNSDHQQMADVAFLATVFAVLACGGRVTSLEMDTQRPPFPIVTPSGPSHTKIPAASAEACSHFARSCALGLRCSADFRLDTVQLHMLQAFYMASCNATARAWLHCGHAMRLSIDLGLHRNIEHESMSAETRETRRWVWWCVYMFDMQLSIGLGRPSGIEDEQIDAQLPEGRDEQLQPVLPGFVALVTLARQAGRITRTINSLHRIRMRVCLNDEISLLLRLRSYEAELDAWEGSLTEALKSRCSSLDLNDPMAVQSCVAFSCLNATRMDLQLALLRDVTVAQTGENAEQEQTDMVRCIQTALRIIKSSARAARMIPPSHYLLEYTQHLLHAGHFLSTSVASGQLANAFQLLNEAEDAVHCFQYLRSSFPAAEEYRKVLFNIVRTVRERLNMVVSHPHSTSSPSMPSTNVRGVATPFVAQDKWSGGSAQGRQVHATAVKRRRSTVSTYQATSTLPVGSTVAAAWGPGFTSHHTPTLEDWTASFGAYDLANLPTTYSAGGPDVPSYNHRSSAFLSHSNEGHLSRLQSPSNVSIHRSHSEGLPAAHPATSAFSVADSAAATQIPERTGMMQTQDHFFYDIQLGDLGLGYEGRTAQAGQAGATLQQQQGQPDTVPDNRGSGRALGKQAYPA